MQLFAVGSGSIVALAIIVWLAFQVSPYPSAWVIRAMFD